MKDKQKTKPAKKKILTLYLILAASILVIAAITVSVIFGVNWDRNDNVIDGGTNNPGGDEDPDDKDPVDTSTQYEFIVPVKDVQLSQAHVFWHDKTMNWFRLHEGMDFSAAQGTEVYAAVDGTVLAVTTSDAYYGGTVTLSHAGEVKTVYAFIDPAEELKVGDKVNRGDVIGKVAKACGVESKEGDHLHFEVYKNDKVVDPDEYLDIIQK